MKFTPNPKKGLKPKKKPSPIKRQPRKKATKDEKAHLDKLASLGCIICGKPAEIHHLRSQELLGAIAAVAAMGIKIAHPIHTAENKAKKFNVILLDSIKTQEALEKLKQTPISLNS